MLAVRKGPPVRVVNLIIDPCQGTASIATVMTIPGYVFSEMERRGYRAKLKFVREDLAGAA
jgi:hypothetical protein